MNRLRLLDKPDGAISWVFFGCSHAPLHNKKSLSIIAERVAELGPDVVIHGGDLHEADSASRWPSEYDWKIEDEFWAANEEVLKPIRRANPNTSAD